MSQQKSTRFAAAKVANCEVVRAEMAGKMEEMEKKMKKLRHHVSVLSKTNHQLMKNGKTRAESHITSDASLIDDDSNMSEGGVRTNQYGFTLVALEKELKVVMEDIRDKSCGMLRVRVVGAMRRAKERESKWLEDRGVEAESVGYVAEAEVAVPVVKLPVAVKGEGSRKRRVEVGDEEEVVEKKEEEVLIAPLCPRAECGGLLRRVGRESVFRNADRRLIASGCPTPAVVGVSRRLDPWHQSPGVRGGYQLRPRGWGI